MLKNLKISPLVILIGVVLIAVLCLGGGLSSLLGGLFGGGSNTTSSSQNIPQTGDFVSGELGSMYTARRVDSTGCPDEVTSSFSANEPIYAGLTESDIPANTAVFARLLYEGQPIEDTQEIVADRDLQNTCIWFAFQPNGGFDRGSYTVEMYVNGNLVDQVQVSVGSGGLFSSGGVPNLDLGQVVTTNRVTEDGCPRSRVTRFASDESIYLAMEESSIPAGTEAFARLYYEGELVEETDLITADEDMNTCLWFGFEPSGFSGGFDPGRYQAELFVNGDVVDQLSFQVE